MLQHDVNIDGLALDGPFVRENLHPIDELHNAIRFFANESCETAIVIVN